MNNPSARIRATDNKQLFKQRIDVDGEFIRGSISGDRLIINQFISNVPISPRDIELKGLDKMIEELNQIRERMNQ